MKKSMTKSPARGTKYVVATSEHSLFDNTQRTLTEAKALAHAIGRHVNVQIFKLVPLKKSKAAGR